MEGALLHSSSGDHGSMSSSYRKPRNLKRMNNQTRPFIPSRPNTLNGNLYHSESLPKMEMMMNGGVFLNPPFPLSSSLPRLNSSPYPLQCNQPPLLPLPVGSRKFHSLPIPDGATQLSPSYKKQNKGNKNQTNTKKGARSVTVSNNRLGPNPESLPKMEVKFCGSVFPEAPPPSSLPMPKFPLKTKMSCRFEANGYGGLVDSAGATGNLCRLLNLR